MSIEILQDGTTYGVQRSAINANFTGVMFQEGTVYIGGDRSGNTRAAGSLDIQASRTSASMVAKDHSTGTSTGKNVVYGIDCSTDGAGQCVAIGYKNSAGGYNASGGVAIGWTCTATPDFVGAVAMGHKCTAASYRSISVGHECTATGYAATAMGSSCTTGGYGSVSIGYQCQANTGYAVAMGHKCSANTSYSTAIGYQSSTGSNYSTAVGYTCVAAGEHSTAFGNQCTASGEYSSAFGTQNLANASNSSAFGYSNKATGSNSSAFGHKVQMNVSDTFEAGHWLSVGTRGSTIRTAGNSMAISLRQSDTKISDGGTIKGSELGTTLPRDMYTARINTAGTSLIFEVNVGGTVKTATLAIA